MAAALGETLRKLQLDDLVLIVDCTTKKYIFCSRLNAGSGEWLISASDGLDVWNKSFDAKGVEQVLQANSQTKELDDYLNEFKKALETDHPKISRQDEHLDIISSSGNVQWRLAKCENQQRTTQLSSFLFYLAMQAQLLKKQVQKMDGQQTATRVPTTNLISPAMNLDSHRKGTTNKQRHKKGMSLVNPGSKKLKGAHGVEFE